MNLILKEQLEEILNVARQKINQGKVASYIPELSLANPEHLGLSIIDVEQNELNIGDWNVPFTIQSGSKPISLMLAILDSGFDEIFMKVNMEPTGDAFNSIVRLETDKQGKPANPMINAGAIQTSSMIKGRDSEERFNRLLEFFRLITENPSLGINEAVYRSESLTGDRNRSLAYFLKCHGLLNSGVDEALEVYFKQCSIEVTAHDLAKIGLFLARDGVLSSGVRIADAKTCRIVKSLMTTCGMYDASGSFATNVGIPSKSGVGGGIMSAVPKKMGIGVFGPSLDEKGNSIAGVKLLELLSKKLELTIF